MAANILLQTTIPYNPDDWHAGRFSFLAELLSREHRVTARDLQRPAGGLDRTLVDLADLDFDQVWILGVDGGDGLKPEEVAGLSQYWSSGRGLLIARDHTDMGACLLDVGPIGRAHYFHSKNPDPDETRRCRDDQETLTIDWPNYHSGKNGDLQSIQVLNSTHPLTRNSQTGDALREFPAHPHEGAVGVPPDCAEVELLVQGKSKISGATFGQVVAFQKCREHGRGIAQSSFHHFADYNWNPETGCPSFVTEKPGSEVIQSPERLSDIRAYIQNVGNWLS